MRTGSCTGWIRPRTPTACTRSNLGRLVLGEPGPLPCTPRGIVELLRRFDVPIAGADVAVIGRGITVGRALGLLLTRRSENATVTLCHTGTRDLAAHTRAADIVVVAAGRPGLLTADMVKPGAAVLDVGITRTDAGLVGDVAPEVAGVAGYLAPMPGGVGPMTRAMLLANVSARPRRGSPAELLASNMLGSRDGPGMRDAREGTVRAPRSRAGRPRLTGFMVPPGALVGNAEGQGGRRS